MISGFVLSCLKFNEEIDCKSECPVHRISDIGVNILFCANELLFIKKLNRKISCLIVA